MIRPLAEDGEERSRPRLLKQSDPLRLRVSAEGLRVEAFALLGFLGLKALGPSVGLRVIIWGFRASGLSSLLALGPQVSGSRVHVFASPKPYIFNAQPTAARNPEPSLNPKTRKFPAYRA